LEEVGQGRGACRAVGVSGGSLRKQGNCRGEKLPESGGKLGQALQTIGKFRRSSRKKRLEGEEALKERLVHNSDAGFRNILEHSSIGKRG